MIVDCLALALSFLSLVLVLDLSRRVARMERLVLDGQADDARRRGEDGQERRKHEAAEDGRHGAAKEGQAQDWAGHGSRRGLTAPLSGSL